MIVVLLVIFAAGTALVEYAVRRSDRPRSTRVSWRTLDRINRTHPHGT